MNENRSLLIRIWINKWCSLFGAPVGDKSGWLSLEKVRIYTYRRLRSLKLKNFPPTTTLGEEKFVLLHLLPIYSMFVYLCKE